MITKVMNEITQKASINCYEHMDIIIGTQLDAFFNSI